MSRIAFVAVFGAVSFWSVAAGAEMQCRASRDLLDLNNPLEIGRTAVAEERELRIVAMGSSSTQGYGATNPQYSYPAQLKMRLEAAMPGINIHVWNKGIGGQDAEEMVLRMKQDVKPERAHIVVWQVGTNSAIRRDPLTKFAAKLRAGIDIGHSLGANFVMMNLQYVPAVVALPDEECMDLWCAAGGGEGQVQGARHLDACPDRQTASAVHSTLQRDQTSHTLAGGRPLSWRCCSPWPAPYP